MERVLITLYRFSTNENFDTICGLRLAYIKKLLQYNLIPVFVTQDMNQSILETLYQESDGLILPSGGDVNPKRYQENKHPETSMIDDARDELEFYLANKALQDKKPILGICRGCQVLAVVSGGKLIQHIPDITSEKHACDSYANLLNCTHEVVIDKNSKIYQILGKEKITVTSGHHQAIKSVGPDFRIVGKSTAGIVEIIEHKDTNYFCFGIQSHFETETNGTLEPLWQEFQKAVAKYKNKK